MGFGADLLKNVVTLNTAKIGIHTSLKLANYFWFVSQIVAVEATTSLRRMQNLVKIGKEL